MYTRWNQAGRKKKRKHEDEETSVQDDSSVQGSEAALESSNNRAGKRRNTATTSAEADVLTILRREMDARDAQRQRELDARDARDAQRHTQFLELQQSLKASDAKTTKRVICI